MDPEFKNKHGETPEETEEYVKELEGSLKIITLGIKTLSSIALCLSFAVALGSLEWLSIFAATGAGAASITESTMGISFLKLGHGLSCFFVWAFLSLSTLILFLTIWRVEIMHGVNFFTKVYENISKEMSKKEE